MPSRFTSDPPKRKRRSLSREEKLLWKLANQHTRVFAPQPEDEPQDPEPSPPPAKAKPPLPEPEKPSKKSPSHATAPQLGAYEGIDKRTAEKFRKGKMQVEATLDLHGMTLAAAHGALTAFILKAVRADKRKLLIITGKGKLGEGAIKSAAPVWLTDAALAQHILAIDYAQQKDGGSGALYVLLRKRRG